MNCDYTLAKGNFYIFTPNLVECERFFNNFLKYKEDENKSLKEQFTSEMTQIYEEEDEQDGILLLEEIDEIKDNFCKREIELSKFLGNQIILKKGSIDLITNGHQLILVKYKGSLKRSGGTGDILSGLLGTTTSMIKEKLKENLNSFDLMKACALSCYLNKEAARIAFSKFGFALTAPNVIDELTTLISKINYN